MLTHMTARQRSQAAAHLARPAAQARARELVFGSLSEQLRHVLRAARGQGVDPRLVRAPAGLGETDPSAGGFLIAEQFAEKLIAPLYEEAVIAPLCDRLPTSYPLGSIKIPGIDQTSRADGSRWGGATAYWAAEGASVSASFPRFKNLEFSAKKLVAVVNLSNELYNDSPLAGAWIERVFRAEMSFKLDQSIVSGTGAGQPQGVLNSGSLITVSKEPSQSAASVIAANIEKMWARLPAPSRRTATWLIHEDLTPQLDQLQGGVGEGAMYLPAGAFGNELPLLKGRPVYEVEQCSVPGSVGDIILADLGRYLIIDGGTTPVLSVDIRFLSDEAVLRFTWRVDGQSAFSSPITPYHGSNTRSPFVTLGAR